MTNRRKPKWFTQWLAQRDIEEEDAYYDGLTPSAEMLVNAFITDARRHFSADLFDAEGLLTENRRFEEELRGAIETAYAAGEPWLRLDALDAPAWLLPGAPPLPWLRPDVPPPGAPLLGWLKLDPRAAARWLLSTPMYRHLVPPAWARVVLRDATGTPDGTGTTAMSEKPAASARGPKPETRERVAQLMRGMARDELRAMKQEQMSVVFGACRETCQLARKTVLSEIVGVSNTAK
jgi:hypothetical protein